MKIQKFDFYWSIVTALVAVIVAASVAFFFSSCEPIEALLPDDWPVHADTIPQDSVAVDTLPTDTITPCTDPIEYTEPRFCTAYMDITDDLLTSRQIIIGPYSDWIHPDNVDEMAQKVDSMWKLYRPEYNYHSYVSVDDSRRMFTIIEGTNDRQQFYLKAQVRYNGFKHYYGFTTQGFTFFGVLNPEKYSEMITAYPSVNEFDFYKTEWTDEEYIKTALNLIGYCKEGRWRAHFGLQQNYEFPDSIIQKAEDAGWNTVLHAPMITTVDLRQVRPWSESFLFDAYKATCPMIIMME